MKISKQVEEQIFRGMMLASSVLLIASLLTHLSARWGFGVFLAATYVSWGIKGFASDLSAADRSPYRAGFVAVVLLSVVLALSPSTGGA